MGVLRERGGRGRAGPYACSRVSKSRCQADCNIAPPRAADVRSHMRPEKIRFWQAAEVVMGEIDRLLPQIRPRATNAADHLERSAESGLFNIGEGVGAYKPKVKISCYEISKKEMNEVRTILRRLVIKKVLTNKEIEVAYNAAGAVIGMLTSAIIALEKRHRENAFE